MEAVRDRSQTDHPRQPLEGEVWTLEGPGVVVVDHRVVLDEPIQHYRVAVLLQGEPTWEDWVTRENPEEPGVGWARRSTRVVPPGEHEVQVAVDGAAVHVEAVWRPLRPSFKSRSALRALETPQSGVGAMEQAHALGGDVVGPALALLGTEADALARARLIEHLVDPEEALTHFEPTPLLVWALAQRWRKHGDVSAYVFVELAELLPADPELLAELAEPASAAAEGITDEGEEGGAL